MFGRTSEFARIPTWLLLCVLASYVTLGRGLQHSGADCTLAALGDRALACAVYGGVNGAAPSEVLTGSVAVVCRFDDCLELRTDR